MAIHNQVTTGQNSTLIRKTNRLGVHTSGDVHMALNHRIVGSDAGASRVVVQAPKTVAQMKAGANYIDYQACLPNADGTLLFTKDRFAADRESYADAGLTVEINRIVGILEYNCGGTQSRCEKPMGYPYTPLDPDEENNFFYLNDSAGIMRKGEIRVQVADDVEAHKTLPSFYTSVGADETDPVAPGVIGADGEMTLPNSYFLEDGKAGGTVLMYFDPAGAVLAPVV